MGLSTEKYFAYDVVITEDNELAIVLYEVNLERIPDSKFKTYVKTVLETIVPENIQEEIKKLRNAGYLSILNFGYSTPEVECQSIMTKIYLELNSFRLKPLQKFYYPTIIDDLSCLVGGILFVDMKTGLLYAARTEDFGIDNKETVGNVEDFQFEHIKDTLVIKHLDSIDELEQLKAKIRPHVLKLTKKEN